MKCDKCLIPVLYIVETTGFIMLQVMGNIVRWCEFNMWWETDLWRREEMHPSDSWPHNREQCCGKPSDLTAGFV